MPRRIIAITVAVAATAALRSFAADVVQIHVRGHYFTEPATVQISVSVEPDAANRVLRIEVDGDREYRSTEVELAGLSDKRIHTIEFKNLRAGAYALRAEVLSKDKVRGMAASDVVVAGSVPDGQ